jgi:hypothetical protein
VAHPPSSLKVQAAYEGRPLGVGSGVIMVITVVGSALIARVVFGVGEGWLG